MSVRKELAGLLTTDWAAIPALSTVRVVAAESPLDDVQVPTALIRAKGIRRNPTAPLSHRDVTVTLTLISQYADPDRAMDELDELLDTALDYLDPRYLNEGAQIVGYGGDRLAADIPLTLTASKDN